jgi:hypothetical protein
MCHIVFCTPWIALVNGGHLLHMRKMTWSRRRKFKRCKSDGCSEVHKRQVARVLTLLWPRHAPVHLIIVLEFDLSLPFIYDSWLCIRLIGVELMPSCIKVTFRFILDVPVARDRSLAMAVGYGRWLSGRKTTWRPYVPLKFKLWFSW